MGREHLENRNQYSDDIKTQEKTKKSKTSYINNSRMFEIQVPLELKASINDRAYVEYILSSSNTKANKLAAVGDSGSNSYGTRKTQ